MTPAPPPGKYWATRIVCAGLLLAAALPILSLLWPLYFPQPAVIEGANGRFVVDNPVTKQNGCTYASWDVEGVKAVRLQQLLRQPRGVIGQDRQEICPGQDTRLSLRLELPDGKTQTYTQPVIVSTGALAPLYLALVALLAATSGVMLYAPRLPAVPRGPDWLYTRIGQVGVVLGLVLLVILLFHGSKFIVYGGDFEIHIGYAETIESLGDINRPNFLFHLITLALAALMPTNGREALFDAAYVSFIAANVLTVLAVYAYSRDQRHNVPTAVIVALTVFFVTPIYFLTLHERNLYMGYLQTVNLFHNPSTVMLKPFAVVLFWGMARLMFQPGKSTWWEAALLAVATVASALIKPNLVMILLPPAGLYAAYVLLRGRRFAMRLLLSIVLPATLVLGVQYLGFFTEQGVETIEQSLEDDRQALGSTVQVRPFAVFLAREPNPFLLGVKFLAGIAFPLAVLARSFQAQKRDASSLYLAWAVFLFGVLYSYFLAEGGGRFSAGNFIWSGQLGLFLLVMASVIYFAGWAGAIARGEERLSRVFLVSLTLLIFHFVSGVMWHAVNIASGYGFFWW